MANSKLPSTMRAWQFSDAKGGLENSMKLNQSVKLPEAKADQHLVQVLACSLNPVDHKPAEVPVLGRFAIPKPAIPGLDFAGRLVKPASGTNIKAGQLVFGSAGVSIFAGGALGEYAIVKKGVLAAAPEGQDVDVLSTINVCGCTAYQAVVPHTKAGQRVFINGGSGGTGVYTIQVAKNHGLHVTTTCSTPNVELCKSLGADVVLDYKAKPVLTQLKEQKPFDHIVDNVGFDTNLYWQAHTYSTPSAKYIFVGATPSLSFFGFVLRAMMTPGFLGGGKRKLEIQTTVPNEEQLTSLGKDVAEGKLRIPIDEKFPLEKANEAMRKLKTHRTKGKIVVEVSR